MYFFPCFHFLSNCQLVDRCLHCGPYWINEEDYQGKSSDCNIIQNLIVVIKITCISIRTWSIKSHLSQPVHRLFCLSVDSCFLLFRFCSLWPSWTNKSIYQSCKKLCKSLPNSLSKWKWNRRYDHCNTVKISKLWTSASVIPTTITYVVIDSYLIFFSSYLSLSHCFLPVLVLSLFFSFTRWLVIL